MKILWFTAAWCGPCQKMKPVVGRVLDEQPEVNVRVYDIDSAEGKALASQYDVSGVPTFVRVDEQGTETARLVGAHPKGKFEKTLLGLI